MKKTAPLTISILNILFLSIGSNISSAQVIAGSVPPGTSIQNLNIMLSDSVIGLTVSDSFDIDCDGIKDIVLDLTKGNTIVDWPNELWFRLLNDSIEICTDTGGIHYTVPFYNGGDTLATGFHQWRSDSTHRLACGGGFCWDGLHQATDKYFAYRKTSTQQIGWIKISFDLFGNIVTTSVNEVLILCDENSTSEIENKFSFSISPNPTKDGKIKIQSSCRIKRIEIINSLGAIVNIIEGSGTEILLPADKGIYLVRMWNVKGTMALGRVWRE